MSTSNLKKEGSSNSLKVKRTSTGRIFLFTDKNSKEPVAKIKEIFTELGLETSIAEIRIDQKPWLRKIMEKESKGQKEPVQIFINSTYFGDLNVLIEKKDSAKDYFINELNNSPGELYNVYKKQTDLIDILPSICYLPPPFPKTITCIIKFTNKVEGVVAFKIKSKHAKKYSVKPKEGILGPLENEKIEFSISKDFEEIPLSDDKFKVECVRILNPKEIKDEKNAVAEASITSHIIDCHLETPTFSSIKVTQFNDGRVQVEAVEERKSLTQLESPMVFPKDDEEPKIDLSKEIQMKLELEQKLEKEKAEKERLEKERIEKDRLEKERLEKENREKERLEKERLEKERLEKLRTEKERIEKEQMEKERERVIREAQEKERERIERERIEKERMERERVEKFNKENERIKKEAEEKERFQKVQEETKKVQVIDNYIPKENDKKLLESKDQEIENLKKLIQEKDLKINETSINQSKNTQLMIDLQNRMNQQNKSFKEMEENEKNLKTKLSNEQALLIKEKSEKEKLESELKSKQGEINQLLKEKENLNLNLKSIEESNKMLDEKLKLKTQEVENVKKDSKKQSIDLETEFSKLKEEIKKKEQDLLNEKKEKELERKNKENEIEGLKNHLEMMVKNQKEKETFSPENEPKLLIEKQEEITKLNKDLIELKNKMNKLTLDLQKQDEITKDLESTQSLLKDKEKEVQELKQLKDSNDKLVQELTESIKKQTLDSEKMKTDFEEIKQGLLEQIKKKEEKTQEKKEPEPIEPNRNIKEIMNASLTDSKYFLHTILSFIFFIIGYFIK